MSLCAGVLTFCELVDAELNSTQNTVVRFVQAPSLCVYDACASRLQFLSLALNGGDAASKGQKHEWALAGFCE